MLGDGGYCDGCPHGDTDKRRYIQSGDYWSKYRLLEGSGAGRVSGLSGRRPGPKAALNHTAGRTAGKQVQTWVRETEDAAQDQAGSNVSRLSFTSGTFERLGADCDCNCDGCPLGEIQ